LIRKEEFSWKLEEAKKSRFGWFKKLGAKLFNKLRRQAIP
jgi:hypothetical protein